MKKQKYSKEEINWAIGELKKKKPDMNPTRDQAIKLLDTFGNFSKIVFDKFRVDTKKDNTKLSN